MDSVQGGSPYTFMEQQSPPGRRNITVRPAILGSKQLGGDWKSDPSLGKARPGAGVPPGDWSSE